MPWQYPLSDSAQYIQISIAAFRQAGDGVGGDEAEATEEGAAVEEKEKLSLAHLGLVTATIFYKPNFFRDPPIHYEPVEVENTTLE